MFVKFCISTVDLIFHYWKGLSLWLMRLCFERYFSKPDHGRNISRNVASLNIFVDDVINLLYHKHWTDKRKYFHAYWKCELHAGFSLKIADHLLGFGDRDEIVTTISSNSIFKIQFYVSLFSLTIFDDYCCNGILSMTACFNFKTVASNECWYFKRVYGIGVSSSSKKYV